ncbi:group III truncated hemoglobin [Lysobacter enzymogenes]|uniref:group III truncated hemoglobin n=1 Tax=Lysobacter enzymogenes TaxID=69 RepID=UPI001A96A7A2|nr:group III truncated hemoglobin [Lysobacter enzymogenes]QQP97114.1 group III truncated hemoglobin [Lysobacter enzymogenes]
MRSLDGLDEAALAALVRRFYAAVRADPQLGPVFAAAVDDWDEHERRLVDFWTSLMLGSGRYRGNPAQLHLRHAAHIRPELFARWLALWRRCSEQSLPPAHAAAVQARAGRIAEHLQRLLAQARADH